MGCFVRAVRCSLALLFLAGSAVAASAQTPSFTLFLDSRGDTVGQGLTQTLTQADHGISVSGTSTFAGVRITSGPFSLTDWILSLSVPSGRTLVPGTYFTARASSFGNVNALNVSTATRSCSKVTGRFRILEADITVTGVVNKLAFDFEQHCDDADSALFGALRYNSSLPATPFDGVYPTYNLQFDAPAHGTVTSTGALNCGTGGTACADPFGAPQTVTLTATADPSYEFTGWIGDCFGLSATTVRVNSEKRCSASFDLAANAKTVVRVDSQAGEPIGGGRPQVYNLANANITGSVFGNQLALTAIAIGPTETVFWGFTLGAADGDTLHTGTYSGALDFSSGLKPRISISGFGSCASLSGRFVVRELVIGSNGALQNAAVDLESHCNSTDPALVVAIRYNSAVPSVPFDGVPLATRLTLEAPAHGTIMGGPLNCGSGGSLCLFEPASPASVTLTATPDPGYLFGGWSGDCYSAVNNGPTTVAVNTIRSCGAAFEPVTAGAARSLVLVDAMAGARFGSDPASFEMHSAAAERLRVTSTLSGRELDVDLTFLRSSSGFAFTFTGHRVWRFLAPFGQVLQAGRAYSAVSYSSSAASAGMLIDDSCSTLTGRFTVLDLAIAQDGTVQRAALDYEVHCNDTDPAFFGSVRFNSTLESFPFGHAYPRFALAVTAPTHGRVTGSGIDCGGGGAICSATLSSIQPASLTASPDPGYTFAGWTGACHGGASISVNVNSVKDCGAVFETLAVPSRTRLTLISQPGDTMLQGRTEIYSQSNSRWNASVSFDGSSLAFDVSGRVDGAEQIWSLSFRDPTGAALHTGTYTGATNSFSGNAPFLQIRGSNVCSVVGSRFTIREIALGSGATVNRVAIDFEQHCGSAGSPPLTGSLLYQSAVDQGTTTLDKTGLSFAAVKAIDGTVTSVTSAQTIRLSQTFGANLPWIAESSAPWLTVTPAFGTGPATLTIGVQAGAAPNGTSGGTVTIRANLVQVLPVSVTLTVSQQETAPPFGEFETPVSNAQNLSGAVAVTGWALDDVEVTDVQIWRQPHPSDAPAAIFRGAGPAFGKVFIGNATFIDGARTDVEAIYAVPNRSRAGWGYMLLTRGLVWDGQGPFTLYAIAIDREGHAKDIGSKTVSVNNAISTKPFGTIDTPGQGATASGLYPNTGWVLTPDVTGATTIPAGNVRLMIDGTLLPGVFSTAPRADISASFPGMDTSQAGRGMFIDTTAFADGMHTIAWIVTDSAGQTEGIGSRFFRVANGGAGSLRAAERAAARPVSSVSPEDVDAAPAAMSALQVRQGFGSETPFETLQGSSDGLVVATEELERVEVKLPAARGVSYGGYLRALGELRPLPAGAALDAATGTFTWQPPAGFIGDYDFVFVATGRTGILSRQEVRVTIHPRVR